MIKIPNFSSLLLLFALGVLASSNSYATSDSPYLSASELEQTLAFNRGVEAAIWAQPAIDFMAIREAMKRDLGAKYHDVVYFSQPVDHKAQLLTPNSQALIVLTMLNTSNGPVVVDIPEEADNLLFGSFVDAWHVPQVDVGPAGMDQGRGGKYLFLPPDYQGLVPEGYLVVRPKTYNLIGAFRTVPKSLDRETLSVTVEYMKQIQIYPLAQSAKPQATRYIDAYAKTFETLPPYNIDYYHLLSQVINEEPTAAHDMAMMGLLGSIGIEKGKIFNPDLKIKQTLTRSVEQARKLMLSMFINSFDQTFWSDSKWLKIPVARAAKDHFTFLEPGKLDVDTRATIYSWAIMLPQTLGRGTFYLAGLYDHDQQLLDGSLNYRINIPANAPAKQFWSLMVYNLETGSFYHDAPVLGRSSYDQMTKNPDGSVDIYLGPKPPEGLKFNWIKTNENSHFFTLFRLYGPTPQLMTKQWKLGDFERIN